MLGNWDIQKYSGDSVPSRIGHHTNIRDHERPSQILMAFIQPRCYNAAGYYCENRTAKMAWSTFRRYPEPST